MTANNTNKGVKAKKKGVKKTKNTNVKTNSSQSKGGNNTETQATANQRTEMVERIKELENINLRLHAEIQNVQKQCQVDIQQSKKIGKRVVTSAMLDFLNTLNLSFAFVPETDDDKITNFVKALKKGFENLEGSLKQVDIEVLNPKSGEIFNPETMHPLNNSEEENVTVKQVVNIGLKIDGQIIQPTTVML